MRFSLREFNAQPGGRAREALLGCCSSRRWADQVAAGRPYASMTGLLRAAADAVAGLDLADLSQALAGHARIGARPPAREQAAGKQAAAEQGGWSAREQAGVDTADQALMRALTDGNQAYEQRFGHIYLACATGRNGGELLALLTERLGNDPATEWRVVAAELAKINQIRLRQLISAEAGTAAADSHGGGDQ